ncbi:MAG: hypothetical protein HYV26_21765 [Candidatus Hydrogenedentes bacterium]|nr:hypothetical protein [Candidatus Hydrogenedentota bacterium]
MLFTRPGGQFDCPNCGKFFISDSALALCQHLTEKEQAALSHFIWRGQRESGGFEVESAHVEAAKGLALPDPAQQLDLLILFYGQNQKSPGSLIELGANNLRAKIGSISYEDTEYIFDAAQRMGLVERLGPPRSCNGRLTISGWRQFHELQRGAGKSSTAFMAMPFGNPDLTQMVDAVFRPAVAEAGFCLKRVDDEPKAGLIDNKIRIDIRLSRLVIADLTNGNHGAYWEAGYAEGLGKPVIYTCNRDYFDENRTHFDTNHCQTVLWDAKNPAKAAEALKATIRATLPLEATMPKDS